MVMTFVSIFLIKSKLLVLIFIIAQFLSYIWYVLSYIPWGRELCSACVKKCFGIDIGGALMAAEEQVATAVSSTPV